MRSLALLYHDVVEPGASDESGFPGELAARYKLSWSEFEGHLEAVRRAGGPSIAVADEFLAGRTSSATLLTFDDGGASAVRVGERLAGSGWRAHFFVTTDRIGTPGFVGADDIRRLASLGHVVGSHTASHPDRMSECSWEQLLHEWTDSVRVLSDILGEPVVTASVAGGYSSPRVVASAATAGVRALFTSEPTARVRVVDGCHVFGRFSVRQGTRTATVGRLASGSPMPRVRQLASWNAKKVAKAVGGEAYLSVRGALLRRRPSRV